MVPYLLTAVGATPGVPIYNGPIPDYRLPPAMGVSLSDGAVLTYNVEVTFDDLDSTNNFPVNGTWFAVNGVTGQTTSTINTLSGRVSGIRARITAYTSGTLSFQVS